VVGGADGDRVNVFPVEELPEIFVLGAVFADGVGGLFPMVGVDVANGHILDTFLMAGPGHDMSALTAHADGPHQDAVVSADALLPFGGSFFFVGDQLSGIPNRQTGCY
jgi:hypothetical protein